MNKYEKQLGMSFGKANGRLNKMIIFDMVKRLNEDTCFRCNKKINTVTELSRDHKQVWRGSSNTLFWDVSNIAWSHLSCNVQASRGSKGLRFERDYRRGPLKKRLKK